MTIIVLILGLAVGSFLNAWIWRSRTGESVLVGRSHCPKCKRILNWYELIPVLSFALQLGKCRGCKKPIDWQYPLVELAMGILFVLVAIKIFNFQFSIFSQGSMLQVWNIGNLLEIGNWKLVIELLLAWYLLSVLVVLFVYDLRYGLVPDKVVLPAIVVAFVYALIRLTLDHQFSIIRDSLFLILSIMIGSGFFAAQYYLSKGRWLGEGDMRIGALMGAMLGWPMILEGLALAYLLGGSVGIGLLLAGRKKFGETVPLGTFLTAGGAIAFLYGSQIWQWYWRV